MRGVFVAVDLIPGVGFLKAWKAGGFKAASLQYMQSLLGINAVDGVVRQGDDLTGMLVRSEDITGQITKQLDELGSDPLTISGGQKFSLNGSVKEHLGGVETKIDIISQKTKNISIDRHGNQFDVITLDNGEIAYLSKSLDFNGEPVPVRSLDYFKPDGTIDWPENGEGFVVDSSGKPITDDANLTKGMLVDRYGDSDGTYVSPVYDGSSYPYESRGLPYPKSYKQKYTYEIIKDINKENYEEAFSKLTLVEQEDLLEKMERYHFTAEDIYNPQIGEIAEVFGAGGGQQIKLGTSVSIYEKLGFLMEVNS